MLFAWEVVEERALGDTDLIGDLLHRGLLVALIAEQSKGDLVELLFEMCLLLLSPTRVHRFRLLSTGEPGCGDTRFPEGAFGG